jgi:hypothetical protein
MSTGIRWVAAATQPQTFGLRQMRIGCHKVLIKRLPIEAAEILPAEISANSRGIILAVLSDERIGLEALKYLKHRQIPVAQEVAVSEIGCGRRF